MRVSNHRYVPYTSQSRVDPDLTTTHLVEWWGKLNPPCSLKDYHGSLMDAYREWLKIIEREEILEGDALQQAEQTMQGKWEKVQGEFEALDDLTGQFLEQTECA